MVPLSCEDLAPEMIVSRHTTVAFRTWGVSIVIHQGEPERVHDRNTHIYIYTYIYIYFFSFFLDTNEIGFPPTKQARGFKICFKVFS